MCFVTVLSEAGHKEALLGLSLSFKPEHIGLDEWWTDGKFSQMAELAKKQAHRGGGHNKFLESIDIWFIAKMPRAWWAEFDTYRLMTKNSASTMHTIHKRQVDKGAFAPETPDRSIVAFQETLSEQTDSFKRTKRLRGEPLKIVKAALPEGYLQTRQAKVAYSCLRNIHKQRKSHWYDYWQMFLKTIIHSIEYPEYIVEDG